MIYCDSCVYWYHCDCLGLNASEIDIVSDDNDDFLCFKCSDHLHHMGTYQVTVLYFLPCFYGMMCQGKIFLVY